MNSFNEISDSINKSKRILMTLHLGPDGDCVASCLSMGKYLETINKDYHIVSYHPVPEYIKRALDTSIVEENKIVEELDFANYDLLLSLDMGFEHLSTINKEFRFPDTLKKINIDHHKDNSQWGNLNYVDPTSSSTCSIIYNFLNSLEVPITEPIAATLAVGILTDTGFLKQTNTTSKDFRTIADLVDKGFKLSNFENMQRKSLKEVLYEGIVYSNLHKSANNNYLYSWSTLKEKEAIGLDTMEQMPRAANLLQKIIGFDFAFFVNEKHEQEKILYSVSFRSINSDVDVSIYATRIGGSGHKNAAGAIISDAKTIDEALNKVIEALQ